jgi:hypothetical protein
MVDNVLQHDDPPGRRYHRRHRWQRTALQGRQSAPVDMEPRQLLSHRLVNYKARGRRGLYLGAQPLKPAWREQEGPRREAGPQRASYDLVPLGKKQAMLDLERPAQLDVSKVDVVGQPGVARIVDPDVLTHRRRPVRARPGR